MEINELKTFVSVAHCSSFSLAAEALFLSQPAVSKRVALLEESLNVKLFDRIGHKVSLTEQGKALLPKAQGILLELEDLRRAMSTLKNEVKGDLTIGASHHIGLRRLPPLLKRFSKQYPEVNLDIRFVDSEEAHDAVFQGELELAVVTIPDNTRSKILSHKVWDDRLHIVVAKDHTLAKQTSLKLADLAAYKAILPSEKTFTRSIIESTFQQQGIPIQIAMNTNYIETIRMMVSIGMGWSALPETMIDKELSILPIKDLEIHRSLGCIYHEDRTLSNAANAMLKLLKNNN